MLNNILAGLRAVALYVLLLVAGLAIFWFVPGVILTILLAVMAGIVACLFALPLIPGVIDQLTNQPNAGRPDAPDTPETRSPFADEFGFFTYLQPGQVKIIQRGKKFVRAIMSYPGHMFIGERDDNNFTPNQKEYWEVVTTRDSDRNGNPYKDSDPLRYMGTRSLPVIGILFLLWVRWVQHLTGAVFTGIYPFQRVRTYPMTKNVIVYKNQGEYELEVKADWSDHYRVADFQFPLLIPSVNTQDKIEVKMIINGIFRVFNPFLTAYHTDNDWGSRLLSSVSDVVTNFGRSHPLDEVLSAVGASAGELAQIIARVGYYDHKPNPTAPSDPNGSTADFGIMISDPDRNPPQILDISAANSDDVKKLGDVARAKVDAEAEAIRAKGRAAELREQGQALRDFPEAVIIPTVEGNVRTAAAAGDKATVIINTGGESIDPMQAAILDELRRNRAGGGSGGTT